MLHAACAIAALALFATLAHADERHVPSQYPTIQSAIDAADHGDEIIIAPGTYREHLDALNKSLTFIGAGPDQTILSGDLDQDGTPDGSTLSYINADADVIPSLTITGIGFEDATYGVTFGRMGTLRVLGCTFTSNYESIVCTRYTPSGDTSTPLYDTVWIDGCTFQDGGGGISLTAAMGQSLHIHDVTMSGLSGWPLGVRSHSAYISNYILEDNAGAGLIIDVEQGDLRNSAFFRNAGLTGEVSCLDIVSQDFLIESCLFEDNGPLGSGDSGFCGALQLAGADTGITVRDCVFLNNMGKHTPVACAYGSFHFIDCHFEGNRMNIEQTNGRGGGSAPLNLGPHAHHYTTPPSTVLRCTFLDNGLYDPDIGYFPVGGGGICLENGSLIVKDSVFRNNKAKHGGAIFMPPGGSSGRSLWVDGCRFEANQASGETRPNHAPTLSAGGAIYGENIGVSSSVFIGNTADAAIGGAIFALNEPTISSSLFYENAAQTGSVVAQDSGRSTGTIQPSPGPLLSLSSSIVTPLGASSQMFTHDGKPVSYAGHDNIIDATPVSIGWVREPSDGGDGWGDDPTTPMIDESLNDDFGDLRLRPGSIAIDAADTANLPLDAHDVNVNHAVDDILIGETDLLGNPRFVDVWDLPNAYPQGPYTGPIDIGPVEFQAEPCLGDTNKDGRLTPADFTAWISALQTNAPSCDQNGDGWCNSNDLTGWIKNFNAGCTPTQ